MQKIKTILIIILKKRQNLKKIRSMGIVMMKIRRNKWKKRIQDMMLAYKIYRMIIAKNKKLFCKENWTKL